MNIHQLLKTGGLAALAAALAVTALPAEAFAQSRGQQQGWSNRDDSNRGGGERRAARSENRGEQRAARAERQGNAPAPRAERPRAEPQGQRAANRAPNAGQPVRAARADNRGDRGQTGWSGQRTTQQRVDRRPDNGPARVASRDARPNYDRNRTYQGDRNRTYQNRSGNWQNRNNDRRWNDNRRVDNRRWNDNRRGDNRWNNRNDHRRWDRGWHNNNQYNWRAWRNSNRDLYRWGAYYAPYRDYRYRRLSIGFTIGSLFYSSRYWINDPWQYRLPPAYGPYRWVRYYDDALLVDTYSGEVVDVIYDFFW